MPDAGIVVERRGGRDPVEATAISSRSHAYDADFCYKLHRNGALLRLEHAGLPDQLRPNHYGGWTSTSKLNHDLREVLSGARDPDRSRAGEAHCHRPDLDPPHGHG